MAELLHYEDFPEGLVIPFGEYHLSAEEVTAFAAAWDPQPFHLDEAAAKRSVLGGLAASGWQASAILVRLAVEAFANRSAAMASNGMEEVKWLKPVYAGETLTAQGSALCSSRLPLALGQDPGGVQAGQDHDGPQEGADQGPQQAFAQMGATFVRVDLVRPFAEKVFE